MSLSSTDRFKWNFTKCGLEIRSCHNLQMLLNRMRHLMGILESTSSIISRGIFGVGMVIGSFILSKFVLVLF